MAGLGPATHVFFAAKTWMPGIKPGMTKERLARFRSGAPRRGAGGVEGAAASSCPSAMPSVSVPEAAAAC